ncbi:MAG: hypothetical protein GX236_06885 [Clostridiaceae bacterium]|nr:hypothetical protein [Clostridiaceae bacterium]
MNYQSPVIFSVDTLAIRITFSSIRHESCLPTGNDLRTNNQRSEDKLKVRGTDSTRSSPKDQQGGERNIPQ